MMFILLSTLVYTPGVLVDLGQPITVTRSNSIAFADRTYQPQELDQLRTDLKTWPGTTGFRVARDRGADSDLARRVSNLFQIKLPVGKNAAGTDNATVEVAVNFRGQCFYDQRMVKDPELKTVLAQRVKMAAANSKKLTMILMLDKGAEIQVLIRLFDLAREAGIAEVELAEQPPTFAPQP
jgi:biopolymer transport protein ExbD